MVDMARRGRQTVKPPVQVHWGRLAVLALLVVGAYFYVSPLRAFFAQQDRYAREVAALRQTQAQHAALKAELAKLDTKAYISQQARDEFQLVPGGMQAFVITGLHPEAEKPLLGTANKTPPAPHISLGQRLADLWHTVLE